MPLWNPQEIWLGKEVFILGGGHSLRGWDVVPLRSEKVIGCNQAWRYGSGICDIIIFCDSKFIFAEKNKPRQPEYNGLRDFGGIVVTNDSQLRHRTDLPWLKCMMRKPRGLHKDALGFNCNTGAAALNLALILGAKVVYLLGFDMCLDDDGRPNYHDHLIDKPSPSVYERMLCSFGYAARDLREKSEWKGRQVFNIERKWVGKDGVLRGSQLEYFPKLNFDEFWEKRNGNRDNSVRDCGVGLCGAASSSGSHTHSEG